MHGKLITSRSFQAEAEILIGSGDDEETIYRDFEIEYDCRPNDREPIDITAARWVDGSQVSVNDALLIHVQALTMVEELLLHALESAGGDAADYRYDNRD